MRLYEIAFGFDADEGKPEAEAEDVSLFFICDD